MQDSRRWIPVFLLGYNLFALNSLKHFAIPEYDHLTLKQLPSELCVSLSRQDEGEHEGTIPYCPPLVEYDGRAWERIKHPSGFWREDEGDFPTSHSKEFDEKVIAQRLGLVGGWWRPANCNPVHNVTLIVPYRDRPGQLRKFLLHIHTFLQLQMIQYKVVVVEQVDAEPFNRGKLLNVGFAESVRGGPTHCYVFHDVDLLPANVKNVYGCTHRPRHLSAVVNSFRYLLEYKELFGGAIAITRDQFAGVNGFSNLFSGWGGEDDDLYGRLRDKGMDIIRLSPVISSYRMLPHKKQSDSDSRFDRLKRGKERYDNDGLNSLQYTVVNHIEGLLYTLIQVKL